MTMSVMAQASVQGTIPVVCTNKADMAQMLDQHSEQAMLTMISHREIGNQITEVPTVLFVNRETQSWTLVERPSPEIYCAVAMGDNIRPYDR